MKRPFGVTPLVRHIHESLKTYPGFKSAEIVKVSTIHSTSIYATLHQLHQMGLISRVKDTDHKYKYYVTDADIDEVSVKQKELRKAFTDANKNGDDIDLDVEDDELLESMYKFKFTTAQIEIVKANKDMPRTQLAKKLGISKLELNIAMERLKKN